MDFIALLGRTALSAIFMWSGIGTLMAPVATINGFARYFGTPLNGAVYVVAVAVDEVRPPIVLSVVTLVTVTLVTSRKEDLSYSAP